MIIFTKNPVQSQFIYCENPTFPDKPEKLIYHSRFPRFFARIIEAVDNDFELELDEMIDAIPDDHDLSGKLKRAAKWYINYKIFKKHGNH